jgi:hypothetical protein
MFIRDNIFYKTTLTCKVISLSIRNCDVYLSSLTNSADNMGNDSKEVEAAKAESSEDSE